MAGRRADRPRPWLSACGHGQPFAERGDVLALDLDGRTLRAAFEEGFVGGLVLGRLAVVAVHHQGHAAEALDQLLDDRHVGGDGLAERAVLNAQAERDDGPLLLRGRRCGTP